MENAAKTPPAPIPSPNATPFRRSNITNLDLAWRRLANGHAILAMLPGIFRNLQEDPIRNRPRNRQPPNLAPLGVLISEAIVFFMHCRLQSCWWRASCLAAAGSQPARIGNMEILVRLS